MSYIHLNLQQLIFVNYIQRILHEKQSIWTEYDSFLLKAYESFEKSIQYKTDPHPIPIKQYKLNYTRKYMDLYHIYKKIQTIFSYSAPDVMDVSLYHITPIQEIIHTYERNYTFFKYMNLYSEFDSISNSNAESLSIS